MRRVQEKRSGTRAPRGRPAEGGHRRERRARVRQADSELRREGVDATIAWHPSTAGPSAGPSRVPTVPADAAADRIVADRYRLSTLLGTGGMGAVWLAEDAVLGRVVALKQFTDRRNRACALPEARAAARITHPGVVRVYDLALDEEDDWIVMEALPGESLAAIIRERGRLPVEEVTQLAVQLLSALQAIHAVGLVHRDIKPSNIQVCGGGRVVITDFGLSSPGGVSGGLRVGALTGSLPYMAPETLIDGNFGPPSDMYALGVTLYIAVEGRPPFEPGGPLSVLDSARSARPEPARHAGSLAQVLDGLLDKDPERRMDIARAAELLRATALVTTT
ncbi:MAG: serine/threonine protein kinase [Modestobacter sp.]|nr:serine/threonine protein kinase [Modestobacter sp.]